MHMTTLIVDNGGDTCKIGCAGQVVQVVSNCVVKLKRERHLYVADQIDKLLDFSSLFYERPFEKGYIVNWDVQHMVWDRLFKSGGILGTFSSESSSLLLTEPLFNPSSLQTTMDETVFEQYAFQSYHRSTCPPLALRGCQSEKSPRLGRSCALVVDCGHSFTHIVPLYDGTPMNYAIKRVNVGGKLLTNYLKEIISYRAWNMMEETHLMEDIKKRLCFVSLDFQADMQEYKQKIRPVREYVLPNGSTRLTGCVKSNADLEPDDQTLKMGNESICVPEVLFNPRDIGIDQVGIPEAIMQAVSETAPGLHGLFYANIVLVGGSTLLPNFKLRLTEELRKLVPAEFAVVVEQPELPVQTTWCGGSSFALSPEYARSCVTKKEYEEGGKNAVFRKMF
jgi:actin-related protein 6